MISEITAKTRLGAPRMRRRPNTVASQATAGAIKICDAVEAVLSHAPSSKESESAPLISGRPIENIRLSMFAIEEPSSTAITAMIG